MHRNQFALFLFYLLFLLSLSSPNQILGEDKPAPVPSGPQKDGLFRKVILEADRDVDGDGKIDDVVVDAMELSVAGDGRVFYAERNGAVKVWKPATKSSVTIGRLNVFTGMEDGLLGITLDPGFLDNNWIYLFYSMPETGLDKEGKKIGENRVSRFTVNGDNLDLGSEKILLCIATQREQCCHSGGSLAFDGHGNLLASVGDNTHPGESDGYSPLDEQPGRGPWNSQKSASNSNDLRGKILRIHPEPDGTATIPKGNLFSPGTPLTRPEIYIMGNRNPFRISVDQRTGFLYWGEVGPDAGGPRDGRGPAGFDEINQARSAGNFGWPYFVADNKPYNAYDFATKMSGPLFDPANPINDSVYNTGIRELPPAQPSFIAYPYGPSTKFPVVNGGGGRTAMAGPVFYFDPNLKSDRKLPAQYDHTLFIYEWSRNWIITVKLDANDHIEKMERFLSKHDFQTAHGHGTGSGWMPLPHRKRHSLEQQHRFSNHPHRVYPGKMSEDVSILLKNWSFSLFLGFAYVAVFQLWTVSTQEWILGSGVFATLLLGGAFALAKMRQYFVNRWDQILHATVILDIFLEAILVRTHDHFGFYLCALGFAGVVGGYRGYALRKLRDASHCMCTAKEDNL